MQDQVKWLKKLLHLFHQTRRIQCLQCVYIYIYTVNTVFSLSDEINEAIFLTILLGPAFSHNRSKQ